MKVPNQLVDLMMGDNAHGPALIIGVLLKVVDSLWLMVEKEEVRDWKLRELQRGSAPLLTLQVRGAKWKEYGQFPGLRAAPG